jgi:hypothetical protein
MPPQKQKRILCFKQVARAKSSLLFFKYFLFSLPLCAVLPGLCLQKMARERNKNRKSFFILTKKKKKSILYLFKMRQNRVYIDVSELCFSMVS